jgi:hypothetical protein
VGLTAWARLEMIPPLRSQALPADTSQGAGEARLLFAGDVCPVGRGTAAIQVGPEVFWPEIAALFREHTAAIVNLEAPLVESETVRVLKSGPVLTGNIQFARFLATSGVTAVTLANNHIMDAGAVGLASTIEALDRAGIHGTGAGPTLAAAEEPLVLSTPAGMIGIVAVAEGEFSAASHRSGGAAPLHETSIVARLQRLMPACALTIVVYHGGNELYGLPSPEMVRRCHAFVDAGAAAVVCHHSHVISGCEQYGGSVIAYGLGNLMFDWPGGCLDSWNTGALLSLRVRERGVTGWQLIGTRQDMTIPVVRKVADRDRFDGEVARISASVSNAAELATEFERFCRSSRESYLVKLLQLTRIERRLVRWGIRPWWRFRRKALLSLLNILQCESHREAAAVVLKQELGITDEPGGSA